MNRVSGALIELENLSGLAHHHRQVCDEPDCRLSVTLAKLSAQRVAAMVEPHEQLQAREILERWPA